MPTQILMPALSPTMEEGKLAKWLVKEGDEVHSGDLLAEIETDKATMEFEAVDEGRIGKILVPEGTEGVKVNQPIALLLGETESESDAKPSAPSADSAQAGLPKNSEKPQPAGDIAAAMQSIRDAVSAHAPSQSSQPQAERIFVTPLARRMALTAGIDLSHIKGSGPRGRIVKADIESAQEKRPAPQTERKQPPNSAPTTEQASAREQIFAPIPDARLFYKSEDFEELPHDSMRKSIARRLQSAKALIPHYYLTIDCRIDELVAARTRLNASTPKGEGGYKLSVNDFL